MTRVKMDMLFTKFLLTQILEILIVNKLFVWSLDFIEKMTNHLEISNVLSWKFLDKSGIPWNFLFHAK